MDLTHKLGAADKQPLTVKLPEEVVKHSATPVVAEDDNKQEHKQGPQDETNGGQEQTDKSDAKVDWKNVGGVFVGVNILVIGMIVVLVIAIKRRRAKKGKGKTEEEVDTEL